MWGTRVLSGSRCDVAQLAERAAHNRKVAGSTPAIATNMEVGMDLKSEIGCQKLMNGTKTEDEWNAAASRVKAANGGYPEWWYTAIVLSGIARRAHMRFEQSVTQSVAG